MEHIFYYVTLNRVPNLQAGPFKLIYMHPVTKNIKEIIISKYAFYNFIFPIQKD